MANRKFLFLVALVFAVPFLAPGEAQASHDTFTTYWTGSCPDDLDSVGWSFRECDNSYSSDGTLDGTWKNENWYDCFYGTFTYLWYEKCNGQWVLRYVNYNENRMPEETDCQCT